MEQKKAFLRNILVGESKAYGFTIAFWGSGTAIVSVHGIPDIWGILALAFGAVLGFGLISIFAFGSPLHKTELHEDELLVGSMIHYIAALAPIVVSYVLVSVWDNLLGFLIAGVLISMLYNSLMILENIISSWASSYLNK